MSAAGTRTQAQRTALAVLAPVYMAAIEPFRRWVVYPAILGGIRAGWRDL